MLLSPARGRILGSVVAESSSWPPGTVGCLWSLSYARILWKFAHLTQNLPVAGVGKVGVRYRLSYDAVPTWSSYGLKNRETDFFNKVNLCMYLGIV